MMIAMLSRSKPYSLLLCSLLARAQESNIDPLGKLTELLDTPISVASDRSVNIRECPGVVSYLTREEILASGARDLADLLRLIPGFDLAYDQMGATGLSVRGLWAYEGKALFLWDGIELPDLLQGNMQLGHRFPVDQIKCVEIIRGPGSAKYGGLAELAVIKITSLAAADQEGLGLGLGYGRTSSHSLRRQLHLTYGHTFQSGWRLGFGAYQDKGRRSDSEWIGPSRDLLDASLNSEMSSRLFYFRAGWRGLDINGLLDEYRLQDPIYRPNQPQQFYKSSSQNLNVVWTWSLGHNLSLTPYASYRRDTPNRRTLTIKDNPLSRTVIRLKEGLRLAWDLDPSFRLGFGFEHYQDEASTGADTSSSFYLGPNKARFASYRNTAAYSELDYQGWVNLNLGLRWEEHSQAGSAFVPRIALTKALDAWHFKLLYSGAFRTPGVLHFRSSSSTPPPIQPEKTRTTEMEAGFRLGSQVLTLNLFLTRLEKPIYDTGSSAINGTQTGSKGGELDYKLRRPWGLANFSYTYTRANGNEVAKWSVPDHDDRILAMPMHKMSGLGSIYLGSGFYIQPSLIWLGSRFGGKYLPEVRRVRIERYNPDLFMNLQIGWNRNEYNISISCFDLLNRKPGYLQAYFNNQPPLPEGGREVVLKARWGF